MKCPICDKATTWKDNQWRPFCSERCQLLDFGNWIDEEYSVPDEDAPASQEQVVRRESPTFTDEENARHA